MTGVDGSANEPPLSARLAPELWSIDLRFGGLPGVVAAFLLAPPAGQEGELALIETGPASTVDTLWAGVQATGHDPARIRQILVTHIHLDHAGAAGILAARLPEARVLVHELGARHLIDPTRLLASATLIYKDEMEHLWGTTQPVPAHQVRVVADGEQIAVAGHALQALYTPGHARHHIAYYEPHSRAVFAGDVGGVRLQGSAYVRPPTPPPDLDLELWDASIDRLLALRPETLYLTHFGPFSGDVASHLEALRTRLQAWALLIAEAVARGDGASQIAAMLTTREDPLIAAESHSAAAVHAYEVASNYEMNVGGYLRYLSKRTTIDSGPATLG